MATIHKGQLQDSNSDVFCPQTFSDVVFMENGNTLEEEVTGLSSKYSGIDSNGNIILEGTSLRKDGYQVVGCTSESNQFGGTTKNTLIICKSDGEVTMQGVRSYVPSLVPRDTATFNLGNATYRWNNVYLVNSPNVSSDERLKNNIVKLSEDELSDFIKGLQVVEYEYQDDKTKRIGVTAQQMEAVSDVSKYFVEKDENGYMSIKPSDLVFPLIATCQKLQKEIEGLKKEVKPDA